ncbi:MAG TPA: prephenate dehydrogenase [Candidatus Saccharimonadales bacterium]|nr:prephenate dehydrogenase [Candidatus Saccharimonadales bacterium]
MRTIGIIGYGSFGKFLAEKLDGQAKVVIYSRRHQPGESIFVDLTSIAEVDYLILSIPLSVYQEYLVKLKPLLNKQTVIIDVCSVKVEPIKLIKRFLPNQPVIATHPLFGPESAGESLKGHTLVICPELSDKTVTPKLIKLAKSQGLEILLESADVHDQQMATVHALTFFIARALDKFDLKSHQLDTPSYKRLLYLAELDKHHSPELYATIQSGNPYAKPVRHKLLEIMIKLNSQLEPS